MISWKLTFQGRSNSTETRHNSQHANSLIESTATSLMAHSSPKRGASTALAGSPAKMAKTISPGGPVYREFASNIYGEILANFDADDSLEYVLIYKNQTSVDIKKHAGTIYFVHPDNKKRLLKVCPISTGDAMCRTRQDFEIARGCMDRLEQSIEESEWTRQTTSISLFDENKLFKEIDKQRQKMAGLRRYVTFLESMSGSYVLFSTVPTITCRISCV